MAPREANPEFGAGLQARAMQQEPCTMNNSHVTKLFVANKSLSCRCIRLLRWSVDPSNVFLIFGCPNMSDVNVPTNAILKWTSSRLGLRSNTHTHSIGCVYLSLINTMFDICFLPYNPFAQNFESNQFHPQMHPFAYLPTKPSKYNQN